MYTGMLTIISNMYTACNETESDNDSNDETSTPSPSQITCKSITGMVTTVWRVIFVGC